MVENSMLTLRNRHLFFLDLILLPVAAIVAFVLRLDDSGLQTYRDTILVFVVVAVLVKLLVFYGFGIYSRFWRYASIDELLLITFATGVSEVAIAALLLGLTTLLQIHYCPRSIYLIDGLLTLVVVGGPRFALRFAGQNWQRGQWRRQSGPRKKVLIMGAGDAGAMIAREMRANPQLGLMPVGFVDDNQSKHGVRIHGVAVLGDRRQIPRLVQDHDVAEVIIALPTAPGAAIRDILDICKRANIPARIVPGLYDILSGRVSVNQLRAVNIEDLLRREPIRTDISVVEEMLRGSRVLVTGAGGSIGSELCRQIARCQPALLILLGHGENSIYGIANELRRTWPELPIRQVIADIRDPNRLAQVFDEHRPETIFHAAAHKHVPLMEENVPEAISNNVQGTANLLRLAETHQVGRFVLISTDKAVNPTSVMGAAKRVAELLVQASALGGQRPYVAVRFGNVLGSRGSVVPLFRGQIAAGGPVTVTHPDVRRYFMTIPEAVQLVLQAAALGQGGEVFLLEMGEPIRIADLAKDLIELSGLQVGRDINIVYTGLRPGEKIFEELFVAGEEYVPTRHEKIYIAHNGQEGPFPAVELEKVVAELVSLAQQGDETQVRSKLKEIVPEYRPLSHDTCLAADDKRISG